MKNICAVILAAGEGTRMKSGLSKVLHRISGKPMISYVLDALRQAGIRRILIVAGSNHRELRALHGHEAEIIFQKKRLGTGHAVLTCGPRLERFKGSALVLTGDAPLLTAGTIRSFLKQYGSERPSAAILTARFENPYGYGRILRDASGDVTGIREELEANEEERAIQEVNSGIYLFETSGLFRALREIKPSPNKKEYYLTDAVEIMVRAGAKVRGYLLAGGREIMGINTRKDLAEAAKLIWERNLDFYMERGVTVMSPDNTYIEAGVKIGPDTVIFPFTYIEGDVSIGRNCKIGPFCKIRAGSKIADDAEIGSFVEINRSSIGKKTLVKHLAYLGDACVGSAVNVGAGTITANFDGKNKNKTRIGDRAFLGCDTVLIAPVSVGAGAKTGAGSVVLRGRNVLPGTTVAGIPAKKIKTGKRK
ncbi:MAG TPA: NTP transferase domain-containing protein [Candidatus Omnitrophota bacterium]|nr:NTP transferase domain-containing protein [Candidatus Omnitrophota bacterium]